MKSLKTSLVFLFSSATLFAVSSTLTISSAQSISTTLFNGSLDMDPKFTLRGRFGVESLPVISVLMVAVDGLADLAYLEPEGRILGFHVPNLPEYTDIDISIQPATSATDIEVSFAVWGLYYVLYTMVTTRTFKSADFDLLWNDVGVGRVIINRRRKSTSQRGFNANSTGISGGQLTSSLNNSPVSTLSNGNTLIDYFFEYMDGEKIASHEVFLVVMAALKDISKYPDNDIVKPFRTSVSGIKAGIQFPELEKPRKEPPFLLYGYLIDTIKRVPAYSLQKKRFGGMMIIISFGSDIIGEAMLLDGLEERASS